MKTLGAFTLQKIMGPDPSKKWYGPITFVKKLLVFSVTPFKIDQNKK